MFKIDTHLETVWHRGMCFYYPYNIFRIWIYVRGLWFACLQL